MANVILALICLWQEPLDPQITWFFQVESCRPCIEQQLEVMTTYFRENDVVELYHGSKSHSGELKWLKNEIESKVPSASAIVETGTK